MSHMFLPNGEGTKVPPGLSPVLGPGTGGFLRKEHKVGYTLCLFSTNRLINK